MTSNKSATSEVVDQVKHSADAYLERLLSSQERFAEAVGTARARTARVSDKFFEVLFANQRDAIALGRAVVAQPAAYGKNMEAIVQSFTSAQERALDLAKTLYREQTDAAAEARALAERALEAGKAMGKPFEKLTEAWTSTEK
jgi:hypothetical protein